MEYNINMLLFECVAINIETRVTQRASGMFT